MILDEEQIISFQEKILTWYAENKRDLPWRRIPFDIQLQQRDPYKILVAEIMSQQTQISRVIPKYQAWIEQFPTVDALADASTTDVLHAWSGLGYNRRGLYLKKCAEALVKQQERSGKGKIIWPQTEKELMQLPGIGEYTARAVLCFAFDKQIAIVDTNVRKVILTEVLKGTNMPDGPKVISQIANQLLPDGYAYEWNQALMDYAATMLKYEKIPIPKQSPFKNSNRYYRGQIIKYLLQEKHTTEENLIAYFHHKESPINTERLENIIKGLVKDSLIKKEAGKLQLN